MTAQTMNAAPTLDDLSRALAAGKTTSRALVEACLARIDDSEGEGARVFLHVDREAALRAADAMDGLRQASAVPSRFAGIPVSIKDLFDIAGQVTRAGSRALDHAAPATQDAPAVARLRSAGLIVIGRTNMSEFAFSGVGLNPHYGTPHSAWDRETGRIPGGSSSGAAVSVSDGMAHAALGTDTGGSCRIPAAFNGLVGYKPTTNTVPTAGAIPLSTTLDSIGPLARSVRCCASLHAILAGEADAALAPADIARLRIGVPKTYLLDGCDEDVARAFEAGLSKLSAAGALVRDIAVPEIDEIPGFNARGGIAPPESLAWHETLIARAGHAYDPRVLVRIMKGAEQSAVDFVRLLAARRSLIAHFRQRMEGWDCLACPTTPIVPPPIAALAEDADYARLNVLVLRNPSAFNVLDGCAISLPLVRPPAPPVGLMLSAVGGRDAHLFRCAAAVEATLAVG